MTKIFVKQLPWDSEFFGINVARLARPRVTQVEIKRALKYCRAQKIKCLYFTADSADRTSVRAAEENGFRFAGVRVSYTLDGQAPIKIENRKFRFRAGKPSDLPALRKLSKNLYHMTRFYFDDNFSKKLVGELYARWIEKLPAYVLEQDGKIAGFVGYTFKSGEADIVLFGVDPKLQGKGIGKILLLNFIIAMRRRGYAKFQTVTQGSNIAAQRLYESAGFRINASGIDYHKWF